MATLVTDPAILAQLNGGTPAPAATAPANADSYTPGYVGADGVSVPAKIVLHGATPVAPAPFPSGQEVTDPALLAQLNGAPTYQPSSVPAMDQVNAFANSAVDAIPIVGPTLTSWGHNVDAAFNNTLAGIPGNPFNLDQETPEDRAAINAGEQAQFPIASGAGTVAGTVAPYMLAGGYLPAAGKVALGLEGGLGTQAVAGGASQFAIGTADALARGENPTDAAYTGLGDAAGGVAAPFLAAGVGHVLGGMGQPIVKGLDALQAEKNAAYDAADKLGVRYTPQAYRDMVIQLVGDAHAAGVSADRHPAVVSMLRDLAQKVPQGYSPTLRQLDQDVRQVISRDVAKSSDPATAEFGRKMINGVDNFVDNATPTEMISGDPVQAAQAIRAARAANTTYRKAETVHEALLRADRRAASTGSGGNIDNAMRQNIRGILDKGAKGFSPVEKALMERLVRGTAVQNVLRLAGKASPEGNGLIGLLELFAAGHDLRNAALPVGGFIAKRVADGMTEGQARVLESMISHGGATAPIKSPAALARIRAAMMATPQLENRTGGDPGPYVRAFQDAVAAQ
jgi:hypothetical protein